MIFFNKLKSFPCNINTVHLLAKANPSPLAAPVIKQEETPIIVCQLSCMFYKKEHQFTMDEFTIDMVLSNFNVQHSRNTSRLSKVHTELNTILIYIGHVVVLRMQPLFPVKFPV